MTKKYFDEVIRRYRKMNKLDPGWNHNDLKHLNFILDNWALHLSDDNDIDPLRDCVYACAAGTRYSEGGQMPGRRLQNYAQYRLGAGGESPLDMRSWLIQACGKSTYRGRIQKNCHAELQNLSQRICRMAPPAWLIRQRGDRFGSRTAENALNSKKFRDFKK